MDAWANTPSKESWSIGRRLNLQGRASTECALLHHNIPDDIFIANFSRNLTSFAAPAAKIGSSN